MSEFHFELDGSDKDKMLAAIDADIAFKASVQAVLEAAKAYTYAREAPPLGNWKDRIEERGWELAQATRAYLKTPGPSPSKTGAER